MFKRLVRVLAVSDKLVRQEGTGMDRNDQDLSCQGLLFLGLGQGVRCTFRISKKSMFRRLVRVRTVSDQLIRQEGTGMDKNDQDNFRQ